MGKQHQRSGQKKESEISGGLVSRNNNEEGKKRQPRSKTEGCGFVSVIGDSKATEWIKSRTKNRLKQVEADQYIADKNMDIQQT